MVNGKVRTENKVVVLIEKFILYLVIFNLMLTHIYIYIYIYIYYNTALLLELNISKLVNTIRQ